jgi:L-ribulose-5-phosphate 3-epimerase
MAGVEFGDGCSGKMVPGHYSDGMKALAERIGVCSWSLRPRHAEELAQRLQEIGLNRVQIDLDAIRKDPTAWKGLEKSCRQQNIHVLAGMFRTVNEDYASPQRIRETGGLLPDETWQDSWEAAQESADLAQRLGLKLVSFHAGFIPAEETDPSFEKMLHRIRLVADYFASRNIDLALETGQESALTLKMFLEKVGRVNVGVNFDPANMLIYDMGNPIDALEVLGPWIKQCHAKDGLRPQHQGDWGEEVVIGTGEVNWTQFLQTLQRIRFPGYIFIEREAGEKRGTDIRAGLDALKAAAEMPVSV